MKDEKIIHWNITRIFKSDVCVCVCFNDRISVPWELPNYVKIVSSSLRKDKQSAPYELNNTFAFLRTFAEPSVPSSKCVFLSYMHIKWSWRLHKYEIPNRFGTMTEYGCVITYLNLIYWFNSSSTLHNKLTLTIDTLAYVNFKYKWSIRFIHCFLLTCDYWIRSW